MEICHDITAMRDGFKGPAFRRGHVIREEDVEELLNIGKKHVFVWEENAGELHEEDCARRMAAMAPVEGAHYTEPSEGKVLLIADTVDAEHPALIFQRAGFEQFVPVRDAFFRPVCCNNHDINFSGSCAEDFRKAQIIADKQSECVTGKGEYCGLTACNIILVLAAE